MAVKIPNVTWYKIASNGMILTVQDVPGGATGLLTIEAPNVPIRRILLSTPEIAEAIGKIMFADFDGKKVDVASNDEDWIQVFIY